MTIRALGIPLTPDAADFTVRTKLLRDYYRFRFSWNHRDESWFFSVFKDDGTPIKTGKRLTLFGTHLLDFGFLSAVAADRTGGQPGRHDLGGRVSVLFFYSTP